VPVGSPCCRGPDAMDLKRTALIATSVDVAANTSTANDCAESSD